MRRRFRLRAYVVRERRSNRRQLIPLILSDIDVHREQTGGTAHYFGIEDAGKLADQLCEFSDNPGPSTARDLLPDLDQRVSAFAVDFVHAVRSAIQAWRQ